MKPNEAPEKIYVEITHPISDKYTEIIGFEDGDGIEYTRTDAFIEKAVKWLNEIRLDYYSENVDEFIDDFKNYMKGE